MSEGKASRENKDHGGSSTKSIGNYRKYSSILQTGGIDLDMPMKSPAILFLKGIRYNSHLCMKSKVHSAGN